MKSRDRSCPEKSQIFRLLGGVEFDRDAVIFVHYSNCVADSNDNGGSNNCDRGGGCHIGVSGGSGAEVLITKDFWPRGNCNCSVCVD